MKIIKRNKSEVDFNVNKIAVAVAKANAVVPEGEKLTDVQIERIADSVQKQCEKMGRALTVEEIQEALKALDNALEYGIILRAKGIVPAADGKWIHFDHVPGEIDVRYGAADVIGKLCVIGSKIDEAAIAELFGL